MNPDQIFVGINNKQEGPFSCDEVKSKIASGIITSRSSCWFKGQQGWRPLGEVLPSFFQSGVLPQASAPIAPQPIAYSNPPQSPPPPVQSYVPPQSYIPPVEVQPVISEAVPLPLAPIGIRVVAGLIDAVVLFLPNMLVQAIAPIIGSLALGWCYDVLLMSSKWKGTLGMKMCGIQVVDARGYTLTWTPANSRYWYSLLSILTLGIGYVWACFNDKRQTLHDKLSGTYVVKL